MKQSAAAAVFIAFIAFLAARIESFGLKGRFWPESTDVVADADARRFAADFDWIIYVSLHGDERGTEAKRWSGFIGAPANAVHVFRRKGASANIAPVESDGEPFTYFLYT